MFLKKALIRPLNFFLLAYGKEKRNWNLILPTFSFNKSTFLLIQHIYAITYCLKRQLTSFQRKARNYILLEKTSFQRKARNYMFLEWQVYKLAAKSKYNFTVESFKNSNRIVQIEYYGYWLYGVLRCSIWWRKFPNSKNIIYFYNYRRKRQLILQKFGRYALNMVLQGICA